jgi:hypothetical protein
MQLGKVEEIRQGCTTITTDCMSVASGSLVNFDSRALSIFGVSYDRNTNEVCSELKTACTSLMNGAGTGSDWGAAMDDISTMKTYEQILLTCKEVGKNCFIRNCMNMESKFGLCTSETSHMRTNLLTQYLCWDEVRACVARAGEAKLDEIVNTTGKFGSASGSKIIEYLQESNGSSTIIIYEKDKALVSYVTKADNKAHEGKIWLSCAGTDEAHAAGDLCRITERIWGACSEDPTLRDGNSEILRHGVYGGSLLDWFGQNTGTYSCRGTECPRGQVSVSGQGCKNTTELSSDAEYCPVPTGSNQTAERFLVSLSIPNPNPCGGNGQPPCTCGGNGQSPCTTSDYLNNSYYDSDEYPQGWTNCCSTGIFDDYGNCCMNGKTFYIPISYPSSGSIGADGIINKSLSTTDPASSVKLCAPDKTKYLGFHNNYYLFCTGDCSGTQSKANGMMFAMVTGPGPSTGTGYNTHYLIPPGYTLNNVSTSNEYNRVEMYFNKNAATRCVLNHDTTNQTGSFDTNCSEVSPFSGMKLKINGLSTSAEGG